MKKRHLSIGILAILTASGMIGCSDDSGSSTPTDPCASKTCGDNEICLDGICWDSTCIVDDKLMECETGKVCKGGTCIDEACVQNGVLMTCDEGWECIKGVCEETACLDKTCPGGQTCRNGACLDNACLDMTCDTGKTCVLGDCIWDACAGKEACQQEKVCTQDGTCQFETAPALVISAPDDMTTDETGKQATIGVSLNHIPASDVTFTCSIATESPVEEIAVDCSSLVFNADNWNEIQSIILTGVADHVIDGNQAVTLTIKTVSEDPEFNDLTVDPLALTNIDVDQADLIITVVDADTLTTTEEGSTGSMTVVLSAKPQNNVDIHITTDDAGEGVAETEIITFSPENWDVPQTVTIKGVDDAAKDGTQEYHVTLTTESQDASFNGLNKQISAYNIDNDEAGISVMVGEIETDESMTSVQIPIRLNSKPESDVTLTIVISDDTEAAASSTELVFTPDNYADIQNITITGVADNIVDGDQNYTITITASSEDPNYKDVLRDPLVLNGTNKDINNGDFVATSLGDAIVTESGSEVAVELKISAIPKSDVKLSLTATDATELSVTPAEIVFTAETWDKPQTVTVKGVDDHEIDGDILSQLEILSASEDADFNGKAKSIEFTTRDDDAADLVVNSGSASLSEKDGKATFSVALSAKPEKPVEITFSSSDLSELAVESPDKLVFTAENWDVAQTVNLKAMDDTQADGNQKALIQLKSTSEDAHFEGLTAKTAEYEILDDESVSVSLTLDASTLTPTALTTTLTVSLSAEPVNDVTVTVTTTNAVTAALDKTVFVFTPQNWNTPQTAKVTNTDPTKAAAAITTETFSGVATNDGLYNNVKTNDAKVKIYAFVTRNFAYTGASQSLSLLPGKYKLQVWGAAGGVSQSDWAQAGPGGYAEGVLELKKTTVVYAVVGGRGNGSQCKAAGVDGGGGGFNGGGASYNTGWGGGGATDIRLEADDLNNRVLVAGGGGGGALDYYSTITTYKGNGGYGGGETGGDATGDVNLVVTLKGATQTDGYAFGKGQDAYNYYQCGGVPYGGGGGGWYGGRARVVYTYAHGTAGSGGSGYANTATSVKPAGYKLTSSDYFLTETKLIGGNASMPSTTGGTEIGHQGNGYAAITVAE